MLPTPEKAQYMPETLLPVVSVTAPDPVSTPEVKEPSETAVNTFAVGGDGEGSEGGSGGGDMGGGGGVGGGDGKLIP